jgi:hypothetical protein
MPAQEAMLPQEMLNLQMLEQARMQARVEQMP